MSSPLKADAFNRATLVAQLARQPVWDLIVIGGGATGLGVALDGISRGYQTLLLEQVDYAKGTSSRSTKLVHGGVRYLAQGNVGLVREALYERGLLLRNAPHLVHNQTFIVPAYTWWGGAFYTLGLRLYDLLAGSLSLGASVPLSPQQTLQRLGNLPAQGLKGGVLYHDGQFDDARLAINLAQTAVALGGTLLNHFEVRGLLKSGNGTVAGVRAVDQESGQQYALKGRAVVNATGIFVDGVRQFDEPGARPLVPEGPAGLPPPVRGGRVSRLLPLAPKPRGLKSRLPASAPAVRGLYSRLGPSLLRAGRSPSSRGL